MPTPFHCLSLEEFTILLEQFPFTRQIAAVDLHHTGQPNHAQDRGIATLEALYQLHTRIYGWQDIAQHLTIASDGSLWTGRSWNQPPVSIAGYNGNRRNGPLMITLIGNFNEDGDRLEGPQRQTALNVIACIQRRFQLPAESLRFPNRLTNTSSPGTTIDYDAFLDELRQASSQLQPVTLTAPASPMPFPDEAIERATVLRDLTRELPERDEAGEAELQDVTAQNITAHREANAMISWDEPPTAQTFNGTNGQRNAQSVQLTPAVLSALRPYVINLTQGEFSTDGLFTSSRGDVDALFDDSLERAWKEAKANNRKLKIAFYAHGGLTSEEDALKLAAIHVNWWRQNQVYPIYFVWETGLLETLAQLMRGIQLGRDIWDVTTDPVIEQTVRLLGCVQIWSGMKRSAERAALPNIGGAWYVAQKLKAFYDRHPNEVEVYGVGHSAGSIFHAYFVPTVLDAGVPLFNSLYFMAPAIRVDLFTKQLLPRLQKKQISNLALFTMKQDLEKADNCVIYRKSLLYLIYYALEPQLKTDILGLEECLRRASPDLRNLFGLAGTRSSQGEVVWSTTVSTTGRYASQCTSHGGFGSDGPTLNSILRRVLNISDQQPIVNFPQQQARQLEVVSQLPDLPVSFNLAPAAPAPSSNGLIASDAVRPLGKPANGSTNNGQKGRRLALCIGIDQYPTPYELSGCVSDANLWANTLTRLGFSTTKLLNQNATRSAILTTITRLIRASRTGDVIVIQYSGHGTQLPDYTGDEAGGDTPNQDEALCPHDFMSGAFVVDDDIAAIFNTIPDGVNVTCFFDCCHSGTISRFAVGTPPQQQTSSERVRFIKPTQDMLAAHQRFRRQIGATRAISTRGPDLMREIVFAACLSTEVAYENNGQGDFTRYATQVLLQGAGVANQEFERRVIAAFGQAPRQHPRLYCMPRFRDRPLLNPLTAQASKPPRSVSDALEATDADLGTIVRSFRMLADLLEKQG